MPRRQTGRPEARWPEARWLGAVVTATAVGWACSGDWLGSGGGGTGGAKGIQFDRRALLASVADQAVGPTFAEFVGAATALETATAEYATAIDASAPDVDDKRAAAQDSWRAAAAAWQRAEVMQLGPAGRSGVAVGGASQRDEIYSWPTINSCRVDQEIVEAEYATDGFVGAQLVNVYGLDALEYLLFHDDPSNTCAGQIPINADGTWDALGDPEVQRRRAAYAAAIADDVVTAAEALAVAWQPGRGPYAVWLATAGEGDSPYANEGAALDELLRAMFYVDLVLKDQKIARPAGISDCAGDTCLADLESQWALASKEHALANLEGLHLMMLGGASANEGTGFDDFVRAAGEDQMATDMLGAIDNSIAVIEAVPGTFAEALAADPAALDASYAAIKIFTDLLKGPFAVCLALQLPEEGGGDAD